MLLDGGVSRVAKGADCKSAVLRLRRFEFFFPHQPSLAKQRRLPRRSPTGEGGLSPRATARQALPSLAQREKAATPKPKGRRRAVAASYGSASHPPITRKRDGSLFDRSRSERRLPRRSLTGVGGLSPANSPAAAPLTPLPLRVRKRRFQRFAGRLPGAARDDFLRHLATGPFNFAGFLSPSYRVLKIQREKTTWQ